MNLLRLPALATLVSLVAACAGGSATPRPPDPPSVSPLGVTPTTVATRVEVSLKDTMRIEPAAMTVRAGHAVTFVVTNDGQIAHEFTIGDEDVQQQHEQEMLDMPGMTHHEDYAITVEPGTTKELVWTFDKPGTTLAGCHVPAHYPAGMKATITIV